MSFWSPSGPPACLEIPSYSTEAVMGFLDFLQSIFTTIPFTQPLIDLIQEMVSAYQVTTPAMTICLQPYDFQTVPIMGVAFSVTLFVDAIIAFFIVKHLISE
jgi:fumarate reductase subunit C